MHIVCTDLEGVLVPEIWIHVAEKTGIEELRLTTRDIADYDVLMRKRLGLLDAHGLKLKDITDVIDRMDPLPGAVAFLDWLRARTQVIIVSDTYVEFAKPLMAKLGWPTLFCNSLVIDGAGAIADYRLRQPDGKRHVVLALQSLNFQVIAMGDSYNDISMLQTAQHGLLFRPPDTILAEYPRFKVAYDYTAVRDAMGPLLE
ncbi:bifunctional phosphoserine phosphatase/homoserine phosphotransferase ThrH [Desulfatitalea alkaliphila]|uniref:phosphoserine phosphatase n=1 Tax=Desulfatitalea alkaliphila TaxID=2929485 RepID=A0AA41R5W7_9BACT|nr:bifunctional phosphoserine phosphatase/homoserine phosphotransferase ThrH [Desulfatitalea alkaliphila]MCJ8502371.1 bifunctional phosphoserine phosphatase/homoserine phosphotransferase ThrH [Desulfatitalea alkaliphila]